MGIIRRENIQVLADKNRELEALEAQYRTLSEYEETFGFQVDYDPLYVPAGRRRHFELEVSKDAPEYSALKEVLKGRVAAQIEGVCKELTDLGVKTDVGALLSALENVPAKVADAGTNEKFDRTENSHERHEPVDNEPAVA